MSTMGGTYQEQQKSFVDLARVLVLALALVFGVLLAEFRNFSAPIAILSSSVLSIAGVVFALLVTNTNFNVASFMGLIMVIGIVAKNGILLLDADEKFRAEGKGTGANIAREAMLHAAQRRLRPIVMTAIAAVAGMLPLALALGAGSQMLQPLAIAVIGGLLLSIFLSLIVTPVIYYSLTRPALEIEKLAEPLRLRAADRDFGLLRIIHPELVARFEPRNDLTNVLDVYDKRAVRAPEGLGIKLIDQLFKRAAVRLAFDARSDDADGPLVDRSKADLTLIDEQEPILRSNYDLAHLRFRRGSARCLDLLLH